MTDRNKIVAIKIEICVGQKDKVLIQMSNIYWIIQTSLNTINMLISLPHITPWFVWHGPEIKFLSKYILIFKQVYMVIVI